MDANKLKAEIVLKGLKPSELLEKMQEKGIKMSKASYYRRIKDFDKFDRAEILAIAEILKLNKEQILDIFFWCQSVLKDTFKSAILKVSTFLFLSTF